MTEKGTEPSQFTIPNVIAMTALATLLCAGTYWHVQTIDALNETVERLQQDLEHARTFSMRPGEVEELIAAMAAHSPGSGAAPENWIFGDPSARFTLVEMTDTECQYCRDHLPVIRGLVETSGGHINAGMLHVPVLGEASRNQARAIECAGEQAGSEAAWKYAQLVFENTGGNGKGVTQSLASLAGKLNLDIRRFTACMESPETAERIRNDLEQARKLGIQKTPTTLVVDNVTGSQLVLQGSSKYEDILSAISKVANTGASDE